MTEAEETQSQKEDLQTAINRSTERVDELRQEVDDAFSVWQKAHEHYHATCTQKLIEEKKRDNLIEQFNNL